MAEFKAPVEDILALHVLLSAGWSDTGFDAETAATVISEFARFAEQQIAPLNAIGDSTACQLTDTGVKMPASFRPVFDMLAAGGWQGLGAAECYGGMGLDKITAAGVSEIFSGACHALQMVCNLVPGAIDILEHYGTDTQKQRLIPPLAEGRWLSTMCLTEPDAGSDLSAIRCIAEQVDDIWQITGEKIFISGGDQDVSGSILHFVLARTQDGAQGLSGLSLFAVPKHHNGQPNHIEILRIEEKLGIHASPTCHMRFERAQAELIGAEGDGLKVMFTLMNHARIDVALQGVAHAQHAHALSADYAAGRIQGRNKDRQPAYLDQHADIGRMLNQQRILALGGRAMCYYTLGLLEQKHNPELVEFLTPLCKVFCSEAGIYSADLGIQVFGGYGYLKDYGIEQLWRDARITAIYEGANGIHGRAMVTRNLRLAQGRAADDFAELLDMLCADTPHLLSRAKRWREVRRMIDACETPERYGHDFTRLSAYLFVHGLCHYLSSEPGGDALFTPALLQTLDTMPWPVRADWLAG